MKKRILAIVAVLALMAGAAVVSAESGTVAVSGGSLAEVITAVSLANVTLDGTDKTTTDTTNTWTAEDPRGTGAGWHLTIAATDFTSDDVQEIFNDGVDGTFTLTYGGQGPTASINEDDAASVIKTRLETLSNVTTVTVTGTGTSSNPWVIRFDDSSGSGIMTATDTTLSSTVTLATIDISVADQQFQITLADTEATDAGIGVTAGDTKPTSSVTTKQDIGDNTVTFLSAATDTGMGSYTLNPDFELEVRAEVYAATYTSTITVTVVTAP